MKNIFPILLFISSLSFSQTTIKGNISNKNESLAFVSVYISELKKGTESDLQGNYIIKDIPNGVYTISYSFVGFKSEALENIVLCSCVFDLSMLLKL